MGAAGLCCTPFIERLALAVRSGRLPLVSDDAAVSSVRIRPVGRRFRADCCRRESENEKGNRMTRPGRGPGYAGRLECDDRAGLPALGCRGRLTEAAGTFRTILAAHPDLPEAHYALGNVLVGQGKPNDAAALFRKPSLCVRSSRSAQCPGSCPATSGESRRGRRTFRTGGGADSRLCRGQHLGGGSRRARPARPGSGAVRASDRFVAPFHRGLQQSRSRPCRTGPARASGGPARANRGPEPHSCRMRTTRWGNFAGGRVRSDRRGRAFPALVALRPTRPGPRQFGELRCER